MLARRDVGRAPQSRAGWTKWRWLRGWSLAAFSVNALGILASWFAVSPGGSDLALWYALLLILPALFALLVTPMAAVALLSLSFRRGAMYTLAAGLIWLVSFVVCSRAAEAVRMDAMRSLALRSQPVVAALHAYQAEHGRPPSELTELVPRYLSAIPATGMAAYPEYQLFTGEVAARYEGNHWVLAVSTPSGGINFDSMFYFPAQNYPEVGHSGWWERVETWAYLHE
jgi:hypothetical protein